MKLRENLNKYVISFLIYTITLFGIFSFFIEKSVIDNMVNYYTIIASGIAIIVLVANNWQEFKWKNLKKISGFLILFTMIWIIITAFMGIRFNIESIKGIVNYGCILTLGYTISNITLTKKDKKFIVNSIFISCFLCIIIGIWQYFSGVNLITYSNDLYPGILGRINSTFYIATILDKYLVLISVLLMYILLKNPNYKLHKILYILVGVGVFLTFSRSGQLIFIFVSGVFFLFSLFKKQYLNILSIIITFIILLLIPGTTTSLQSGLDFVYEKLNFPENIRVDLTIIEGWFNNQNNSNTNNTNNNSSHNNEATETPDNNDSNVSNNNPPTNQSITYRDYYRNIGIQLIKEYPIFGIGVGNYSYLVNNQNFKDYLKDDTVLQYVNYYMYPHNNTIQMAAEIGYIGLLLVFISIISISIYEILKKDKMVILTLLMLMICLLLSGYTESVFSSKQYILIFIIIYSFLCSKEKKNKPQKIDSLNKLYQKSFKGTKDEFIKKLEKSLVTQNKEFIVTANPETFMKSLQDENYMNLLQDKKTTIIADGIGIIKTGKILNYDFKERIPGVEITEALFLLASKYHKSIYFLGSTQEVLDKIRKLIKKKYKGVKIIGAKNGFDEDKNKVFQEIIKKQPDIVLVALGIPQQEKLIYKYLDKFEKGIFIGIGGSLDVLSGTKKRAPKIFIKLNLEWLYRIIKEPKRIKKFWNSNIKFLFIVKRGSKNEN